MEEDSKIIDLLYKREEQALIELSEKYGTACKRIAGNILKNHRDAEECVNDTMRTLVLSGTAIMMWRCRNWRTVLWQ